MTSRLTGTTTDGPRAPVAGVPRQPATKGERTRARILASATDLFARSGTAAVSLREIAQHAGLTHAGLLRHFPGGKDQLVLDVLGFRDETDATDLLDESQPALDHVHQLVEIADRNARTPGLVALYAKVSNEATSPEHPAHHYFERRYALLRGYFERLFDEALPADRAVTARAAAEQVLALLDGLQTQWLLAPDEIDMGARVHDLLRLYGVDLGASTLADTDHTEPA